MKMHHALFRFMLALAGGILLATLARAEPAVVGNKCFAGESLDGDAVKAALLGKKVTVGATRIVIVIVKTSDAQEQLLQQSVGMNTSQFQNYWRRLFMTGGGTAPKIVESEAEAARIVAETSGAIAVLERTKSEGLVVLAGGK